jgi:aminoglycoside phosphotransferase (APT) family kinase protein
MTHPDNFTLSSRLLNYLRHELDNPSVQYRSPLTSLKGGFVTELFKFELDNVPEKMAHPLVLRLFPSYYTTGIAMEEGLVHQILTTQKYPVPQVYFHSVDTAILGKQFIIMQFILGDNLRTLQSRLDGSKILSDLLVELHTLDPTPIMTALKEHDEASFNRRNSVLSFMETRIPARKLWWLQPGLEWLQNHQSDSVQRRVLCHGDMNLGNIMINKRRTAAVLDWGGFFFCDPEYDLASIKVKFLYVAPFMVDKDFTEFYNKCIKLYQQKIPIKTERLQYYEAVYCIRFLIFTQTTERLNPQGAQESLIHRFSEITGITLNKAS